MPTLPIPVFVALVLGFACLRLCREEKRPGALAILLGLCAAQSLIIALAQHYMAPGMRSVQAFVAALIPPAAWLAWQVTAVRPAARADLLHALAPLLALAALLVAPGFLDILLPGAFIGYGAAILTRSLQGADAQPRAALAHDDIPSRIWRVIGAALVASALSDILIVLAQFADRRELQPWIITVFSVGNLLLIGLLGLAPQLRNDEAEAADLRAAAPWPDAGPQGEADAELWERVSACMAQERPYLDPNLSLARLARKLRVPAKALSATINRATGENVSRFVNAARIRAAQAALLKGDTVTEAMLASGFNTKSNFNREFLRVSGASPRDWLQAERRRNSDRTGAETPG